MVLLKSIKHRFFTKVLITFIIYLLLSPPLNSLAQFQTDSLSMARMNGKYRYYQGGREIRFFDVVAITKPNPKAKKLMKYAKNNYTASNFFFGLGIITFAFGSLYYLDTGDKDKILAGVARGAFLGGMMVGVSIPLKKGSRNNTRKAIDAYNLGLKYQYTPY